MIKETRRTLQPDKFTAWMQVLRPANVLTSVADGMAGFSVLAVHLGSETPWLKLPFLLLVHAMLYAGGIMMNDVFDAELDSRQRRERPIPSGRLTKKQVRIAAQVIQIVAVLLALILDPNWALWSILIIGATYWYNASAKHSRVLGPAAMGLCRALNFLLPLSANAYHLEYAWIIALLPLVYIAGITLSSQYEVEGGSKRPQLAALVLYLAVFAALADLISQMEMPYVAAGFWLSFLIWLMPKAFMAWQNSTPQTIRGAVKAGVLGLLWYNAALCSAYGQWPLAVISVAMLPACIWLGKRYAVT